MTRHKAYAAVCIVLAIALVTSLAVWPVNVSARPTTELIDGFEDNDLNEYNGDTGSFSTTSTRAYFSDYSLRLDVDNKNINRIDSSTGLDRYPQAGDTFTYRIWFDSGTGSGRVDLDIALQNDRFYRIGLRNPGPADDLFKLTKHENGTGTNLDSTSAFSVPSDEWLKIKVNWGFNGNITVTLYNVTDDKLAQLQATDKEFTDGDIRIGEVSFNERMTGYLDEINLTDTSLYTVTGTITDSDGNVLEGAEVTINNSNISDTSDVVGDYSLNVPNGTYEVTASKSGYRSNSTVVTVNGADITGEDIVLTESVNVSGSVTEAGTSGPLNGLGNITISTNRSDQTATTATDGTGDYTIKLENNATHNITASSPNWFNETITVEINDSDKTGIDFALEDLHAHISGQVTSNESGDVLEDVLVESNTTTANATTNNNGFYEFQIEPGKNIITASKSGFTDDTLTVWVNESTVSADDHDLTDKDLVLGEANYTVSGTVNSSDGGLLSDINITVVGEDVTTQTETGDWNVSLPDGSYTIKAHHPFYFNESKDVEVDGANVTGVDMTMDPVHAHISGTVTYAKTGNPIEGALVESNTTIENDTTDANGDYAFEIDRGVNNITASKSSFNDGSITVVVDKSTVSKNDHTLNNRDIQLTEPEDFIVSGQVTHVSTGDGVADVSVSTNLSDTTATTDNDGNYQIALDNGTHKLTFSKDKFKDNTTTVTVNGSDVSGVDVLLVEIIELQLKVPSHMWANTSDSYTVLDVAGDTDIDITDKATVTSSDPTNLTVYESNNTLVATSDITFSGVITITANYSDKSVSRDVTIANKSVENVDKFQNAADMFAGLWGDPVNPNTGERKGGDQLTMRVLFIAVLLGAAIVPLASAFAGIGMTTLVVAMGWFMGWVGDGMALVTVFTGLFIGLNVAANIDYSVRR